MGRQDSEEQRKRTRDHVAIGMGSHDDSQMGFLDCHVALETGFEHVFDRPKWLAGSRELIDQPLNQPASNDVGQGRGFNGPLEPSAWRLAYSLRQAPLSPMVAH
jgi:hypothetical protein